MKTFVEVFEYQPAEEQYNGHDQSFYMTRESFCSIGYYNVNKIDAIHNSKRVYKNKEYRLISLSCGTYNDLLIKEEDAKLLTE